MKLLYLSPRTNRLQRKDLHAKTWTCCPRRFVCVFLRHLFDVGLFLLFEIGRASQTRYRDLLDQTDAQSKAELTKLIRGFVFDLRAKNEIAMDRRRRARTKGDDPILLSAVAAEHPFLNMLTDTGIVAVQGYSAVVLYLQRELVFGFRLSVCLNIVRSSKRRCCRVLRRA